MASAPPSYSLWVRHNYDIRRFVVFDGYPIGEFEAVLQASFDEDARIFGGTTSDGTQMVPLAVLCANPSFKVSSAPRACPCSCGCVVGCCAGRMGVVLTVLSCVSGVRGRVSTTCAPCPLPPRPVQLHRCVRGAGWPAHTWLCVCASHLPVGFTLTSAALGTVPRRPLRADLRRRLWSHSCHRSGQGSRRATCRPSSTSRESRVGRCVRLPPPAHAL